MEAIAAAAIHQDYKVLKMERPLKDAEKFGAVTLLGEKYSDPARFILINKGGWDDALNRYSLELCGGTHIDRLGELILVKILKDSSVSRGVRRIEGVAGLAAVDYLVETASRAEAAAARLSIVPEELPARIEQLLEREKKLRLEIDGLKKSKISGGKPAGEVDGGGDYKVVLFNAGDADAASLRGVADELKGGETNAAFFVCSVREGRLSFVVSATKDIKAADFSASETAKKIASFLGGNGGGRKDFAQGGGQAKEYSNDFKAKIIGIIRGKG